MQSGTDARHCSLAELTWEKSVAKHEYVVAVEGELFSLLVVPSKIMGNRAALHGSPVEFYLSDAITQYLFQHWHSLFSPGSNKKNAGHKFVFPKICKNGSLDFTQQYTYENHQAACLAVAKVCGIPVSQELLRSMGTNAIRRGNAAALGLEIKGGHNLLP